MRALIGCERSGQVREAFRRLGHDAWSCDLEPADDGSPFHFQQDLFAADGEWNLPRDFDLGIFHPPCTHLSVSGARWLVDHWVTSKKHPGGKYWHDGTDKRRLQRQAIWFFLACYNAPIPRVAVENPICVMSSQFRKPDQILQPWQHGHGETKATCLWLRNLPKITPTNIVEGREQRLWKLPPSKDRAKIRSETYPGIAKALAEQWSNLNP